MKKRANELNRAFSKKEVQIAKKQMKNYSTSLAIKEMEIKTTIRFLLTTVISATIKNTSNNKCWQGCGEKGILIHCWWVLKLVQALWKTTWRLLRKLKIELTYDPAITFLGLYWKKC
jgi:hypothetical protein